MARKSVSNRCENLLQSTVLCTFHARGVCNRGSQCGFAHGTQNVKVKPDLAKTKMCPSLLKVGRCSDPTCTFAHSKSEIRRLSANVATGVPVAQIPLPAFVKVHAQASPKGQALGSQFFMETRCGSETSSQTDTTESTAASGEDSLAYAQFGLSNESSATQHMPDFWLAPPPGLESFSADVSGQAFGASWLASPYEDLLTGTANIKSGCVEMSQREATGMVFAL